MNRLKQILFHKVTLGAIFLVLQLVWLGVLVYKLGHYSGLINLCFLIVSFGLILVVVASKDNPVYKIAWIILIGLLPVFGSLLYLVSVNKRPTRKLREAIQASEERIQQQVANEKSPLARDASLVGISNYLAHQGPYAPHENTAVAYFPLGEDMYAAMLEDLRQAKKFIFFEYFIVAEGQMWQGMKEIFIQKAREGVEVRVMYDDLGSLLVLPKNFREELEASGVKVVAFNPMVPYLAIGMNNRDHRKILVIDGNVAYNGGINIADEYINVDSPLGHWKDTGLRLEGAAVANLTQMFLGLWDACYPEKTEVQNYLPTISVTASGLVQPFSDSPLDEELVSENLYMHILWNAQKYVYIFTPYLIIDHEMTVALTMAAKRGVDVRIVVPKIPDKQAVYNLTESYFAPLLEAGVRIYRYSPGFIHAKSYLADDQVAVVGTINMDYRSLYLHFECGTFLSNVEMLADLKEDYFQTFDVSEEVFLEDLETSYGKRLSQAVLKVLSPLF